MSFIFLREMDSSATLGNETPVESLNVFYAFISFYFIIPKCSYFFMFFEVMLHF